MLSLSDADLARLRLECYRTALDQAFRARDERDESKIRMRGVNLLAWCLRDREGE